MLKGGWYARYVFHSKCLGNITGIYVKWTCNQWNHHKGTRRAHEVAIQILSEPSLVVRKLRQAVNVMLIIHKIGSYTDNSSAITVDPETCPVSEKRAGVIHDDRISQESEPEVQGSVGSAP